ncbi:uncharacterized protein N7458_000847 [Penicillium daleae]|uniref:Uncharacterized protein n=1 Tax=Penicillium daleae TaxID=63821 RepID=A0AAD6G992_9EURO|nr:uncharacterized protein N7458_000847 [Penicillium daleae]KAJ5465161.1 hypothetical protein N7458_000847 [Penicillium daleae]
MLGDILAGQRSGITPAWSPVISLEFAAFWGSTTRKMRKKVRGLSARGTYKKKAIWIIGLEEV